MHNLLPGANLLPGPKLHPVVNLHPLCSVYMSINCVHMSWICSLNISQMFQFYIKEKFDVLRIIRLLVSSRYRRVRKMQLHLVLFALFIYIHYLTRIMY